MGYGYPKYVPVAKKKAKAEKQLRELKKKNPGIAPIVIEGNALARTWWGKSWNKNLERYADYSNRIGRGRSYVRHGAVLDLKIEGGQVTALVQGSEAKPYKVVVKIAPVKKVDWERIRKHCQEELRSLPDLLAGKFPKALGEIFLAEGKGLFPTPKEISFNCSCPDRASMCKHVAATLYGIGARLDEDPLLFFTMRQVDTEELVDRAVKEKTGDLLAKAKRKSAKVIDDADLSGLFGIDMDVEPVFTSAAESAKSVKPAKPAKPAKSAKSAKPADAGIPERKSSQKKAVAATKSATASTSNSSSKPKSEPKTKKKSASAPAPAAVQTAEAANGRTATSWIEEIVRKNRKNTTVAMLEEATGFSRTKIYAITSRLRQQGRITYVAQGVYGPA